MFCMCIKEINTNVCIEEINLMFYIFWIQVPVVQRRVYFVNIKLSMTKTVITK